MGSGQKIGILINCLEVGGAQKMALQVFDLFEQLYGRVLMMTTDNTWDMPLHPDRERARTLESKFIRLSRLDAGASTPGKIIRAPLQYIRLLSCIRSHDLDVLISFEDRANIFNMLSLGVKKRVISIRHPMQSVLEVKEPLKAKLIYLFFSLFRNRVSMINFNSYGSMAEFTALFNAKDACTSVIHNFCDHRQLAQNRKAEPVADEFTALGGKEFIVACGRFKPVKGFLNLIRIFSHILARKKGFRLVILGDGPMRGTCEALVRELNLGDRVVFPGFQTNTAPWIAAATAFVLTSQSEGFPNVVLEAMALGTPVVAVDCKSGPREILDPESDPAEVLTHKRFAPYGVLTRPMVNIRPRNSAPLDDAESDMAEALLTLLSDPGMIKRYEKKGYLRSLDFAKQVQEKKWISLIQNQGIKGG
ncbi:MAG: glycosyltransferase [Desulfobacterales bacterium]|nr:glycosyltransferase [Desulfobacterales bacterium]